MFWSIRLEALAFSFVVLLIGYVAYQRYAHPLSRFPGPIWASLTGLWKLQVTWGGSMPAGLCQLHERYGKVVRIGPNELSFNGAAAVDDIYKAGRVMEKGPFYDGFTAFKPNVFGLRDENKHALRRRQMAHSFSVTSLLNMETIFDHNVANLRMRLDEYNKSGAAFDFKDVMARYQYDVMGELSFDTAFGSQLAPKQQVPVWNDHFLLGCVFGAMPSLLPYSMRLANYLPLEWLQKLVKSRAQMRAQTISCVSRSLQKRENRQDKSLLRYVIEARDPVTGEGLSEVDICTEAFGFLVAGSHTTSASLTLLMSHLLDHPDIMQNVVRELDDKLPTLDAGASYEFSGLEEKLPLTDACVKENFRSAPVAAFPLSRIVAPKEGLTVDGFHLPQGTLVGITNTCLHHNPAIFGEDHAVFRPSRWLESNAPKDKYLLHFGSGHRMCMGRNLAKMSIYKVMATMLKNYDFELAVEHRTTYSSKGLTEVEGPLLVKVKQRL